MNFDAAFISQVFIYLNRRASLIDTTTCRPAYHIAEPGEGMEPFPARSYDLIGNSASDLGKVEQYWYDMWDVCISTPLNRRHAGESVTIENMEAKMAETLKPRACDEVEARDLGEIPGDHKGLILVSLSSRHDRCRIMIIMLLFD